MTADLSKSNSGIVVGSIARVPLVALSRYSKCMVGRSLEKPVNSWVIQPCNKGDCDEDFVT